MQYSPRSTPNSAQSPSAIRTLASALRIPAGSTGSVNGTAGFTRHARAFCFT